ncbi:MAG: hypothetical protein LBB21_00650 [Holosporaceae bacterium]|jgi:hypothetical protein|nr:hypothetical protein [Holosporaceae bacterium]
MSKDMPSQKKTSYFTLYTVLFVFAICILLHTNWVLGDDWQFINTTAIGKPSRAWAGNGRFWPLGLVDYSLLLLVPYGYTATDLLQKPLRATRAQVQKTPYATGLYE